MTEEIRREIEGLKHRAGCGGRRVKTSGEISPADLAPVVASGENMKPVVFAMEWGYTLPDGRKIINARSETVHEKGMFRDGLRNRRCLIPASDSAGWEAGQNKYDAALPDERTLYMAGLYRMEGEQPVFTILTREQNGKAEGGCGRVPVVLHGTAKDDWLDLGCDALDVLRSAENAGGMQGKA